MSFIINPYIISPPPTYTYNTRSINTSDASSYTFSSLNIGSADANRFVVVCVAATRAVALNITSLTIGGNSATLLAEGVGATRGFASIYGLAVSSGATADVVVNLNTNAVGCAIASYSLYGLSSTTPFSSATSSSSPLSLDANTIEGAILIGLAHQGAGSTVTHTWSGLTERWDEEVEAANNSWSGADAQVSTSETPRTISATFSSAPSIFKFGALVVMR